MLESDRRFVEHRTNEFFESMDILNQNLKAIESKLDLQIRLESLKELWLLNEIERNEYVRLLKTVLKT